MVTEGRDEDGRRGSERLETALRELLASGSIKVGAALPTQRKLAEDYGVSRDTVQRVLAKLTEEGWLDSRQGSRVWVARLPAEARAEDRPVVQGKISLRPRIDRAFEQEEVTLDVFTLTCETLLRHLKNQEERVLAGEIAPRRVRIRMLLPWEEEPLLYPRAMDPADPRVWQRWRGMVEFNLGQVRESADSLRGGGVDIDIEVRRIPAAPQFKLYILNESEMLFGPYEPVLRKIRVPDADQPVDSLDVLGLGSTLSYHRLDPDRAEGHDSLFFTSMTDWFTSNWENWPTIRLRSEEDPAESPKEA